MLRDKLIFPIKQYNIIVKKTGSNKGLLQGGILSSLLINWTLDGLSDVARRSSVTNSKTGQIVK